MSSWLYLFPIQPVGVVPDPPKRPGRRVAPFVKDIPRQLRSGCGLCVLIGERKTRREGG